MGIIRRHCEPSNGRRERRVHFVRQKIRKKVQKNENEVICGWMNCATVFRTRSRKAENTLFLRQKAVKAVAFLYHRKTALINVIGSTRTGEIPRPTVNNGRAFALLRTERCKRVSEQAKRFGGDRRSKHGKPMSRNRRQKKGGRKRNGTIYVL